MSTATVQAQTTGMAWQLRCDEVYQLASAVGQQFQSLIGAYGARSVSALVPLVVDALERLELYAAEHERLQASKCRLELEADRLTRCGEEKVSLVKENKELTEALQRKERECSQFIAQIKKLQDANEHLHRKNEMVKRRSQKGPRRPVSIESCDSSEEATPILQAMVQNGTSETQPPSDESRCEETRQAAVGEAQRKPTAALFTPIHKSRTLPRSVTDETLVQERLHRRLSSMEEELTIARRELLRRKKIEEENEAMKKLIEEMRAEVALQHWESQVCPIEKVGEPKFYKRDLLTILHEKTELKERIELLADELKAVKAELKCFEGRPFTTRDKRNTKIREILESFTGSYEILH